MKPFPVTAISLSIIRFFYGRPGARLNSFYEILAHIEENLDCSLTSSCSESYRFKQISSGSDEEEYKTDTQGIVYRIHSPYQLDQGQDCNVI